MTRVYDVVRTLQDYRAIKWSERANSSGTAGTYLKARVGAGTRARYLKLSRFTGVEIDGSECVNEIVASRLMRLLGIEALLGTEDLDVHRVTFPITCLPSPLARIRTYYLARAEHCVR